MHASGVQYNVPAIHTCKLHRLNGSDYYCVKPLCISNSSADKAQEQSPEGPANKESSIQGTTLGRGAKSFLKPVSIYSAPRHEASDLCYTRSRESLPPSSMPGVAALLMHLCYVVERPGIFVGAV